MFSCEFCKFLRKPFLQNTFSGCFCPEYYSKRCSVKKTVLKNFSEFTAMESFFCEDSLLHDNYSLEHLRLAVFESYHPLDTGRKLNVRKTLRGRPGVALNVFCTFSLRPVPAWNTLVYSKAHLNLSRVIQYYKIYRQNRIKKRK